MVQRQTAYKVWISDLHSNEYVKREGQWESNYIRIENREISRVNIFATVVQKYENPESSYNSLTIEDGSDTIRVKAWGDDVNLIKNVNVGDMIMLIGKLKKYNEEVYILPEIIKPLNDVNWFLVRKLELLGDYGKPNKPIRKEVIKSDKKIETEPQLKLEEEKIDSSYSKRQEILNIIEKLSIEEGIDLPRITSECEYSDDEIKEIIEDLLKNGEVYELKPGKLKILQ